LTAPALAPLESLPRNAGVGTLPPLPSPGPALPALSAALAAPAAAAARMPAAGLPDAAARAGPDVATGPAAAASAVPRLNLDLPRLHGGELSRGSGAGVLQLLPRPPELSDKLARDIDKAAKADCRSAYAGAGLLAVVPLALDAARKDGGCKW
jgi:hypothetical protein